MLIGRRPLRSVAFLGGTGLAAGFAKARADMRAGRATRQPPPVAPADLVTALRDLQGLKDQGVLTPEEFAAAKRKVLGSAPERA